MPTSLSTLFDTLLMLAGLVLVIAGLVMFIRSKTSTQASSVEAFGIKLNVTHPSLILVLAGVGLMLAPRLLPGLPDAKDDAPKPAIVAEAPVPPPVSPPSAERPAAASPSLPEPTPPLAAAQAPRPAAPAKAAAAPVAQAARTARTENPPKAAAPAPAKKPVPERAGAPAATPMPAAARPEADAAPPAIAKPARPTLVFAALALPSHHGFWSGESQASYTRRVHDSLQQAGRDVLRMQPSGLTLSQREFDAWWNESSQQPRSRELCAGPQAPVALLSARVETPTANSAAESAYWPELRLRLYVCGTQRMYRQQRSLSPQNADAWPFSLDLDGDIERFLRTYRDDLKG